jgi:hypothetical protein
VVGITVQEVNQKRVTKKKFFSTTTRKKDAVREDFGHLPPEQRRLVTHSLLSFIFFNVIVFLWCTGDQGKGG